MPKKNGRRVEALAPSFSGLLAASPGSSRAKANVKKRDTGPELMLRGAVAQIGLRYRVNKSDLPGRPDLVFTLARVAVFCDGDFWHGRSWPARRRRLLRGTNSDYWIAKVKANMHRDRLQTRALQASGWVVLRYWEGVIRENPKKVAAAIKRTVVRERAKRISGRSSPKWST
jgi:DNA mismatch endonuclease (patch repair protein)